MRRRCGSSMKSWDRRIRSCISRPWPMVAACRQLYHPPGYSTLIWSMVRAHSPRTLLCSPMLLLLMTGTERQPSGVQKASQQMYMYNGAPPPMAGRMAFMPISAVQPILPLQRADGYSICCKPEPGTGGRPASGGANASQPGPSPPPRRKITHEEAASTIADTNFARGDNRQKQVIVDEVRQDLRDACPNAGAAGSSPA
jgi:hypothetical protein